MKKIGIEECENRKKKKKMKTSITKRGKTEASDLIKFFCSYGTSPDGDIY